MRPHARGAIALLAVAGALAGAATAHAAGELKPAGCISDDGSGGCRDGRVLNGVYHVTVSPDGRNAYVAGEGGVAILVRDAATGALNQASGAAGCINDGKDACEAGGLPSANEAAVSPDGRNVYVANPYGVWILDRDAGNGALKAKPGKAGCITEDGSEGACQDGTAVEGAASLAVSRDGRNVYIAAYNAKAVAIFSRDPATGELAQKPGKAGCVSEGGNADCEQGRALDGASDVAASPDGRSVYVTSQTGGLAVFDRVAATGALQQKPGRAGCVSDTGTSGACQAGRGLGIALAVAVSPDGRSVYATTIVPSGAVARFDRDRTGALTQQPGFAAGFAPTDVAVSPDGRSAYVVLPFTSSVEILDRDAAGALHAKPGVAGCLSENGSAGGCQDGAGLLGAFGVAVSPDGRNVYAASQIGGSLAVMNRAPAPVVTPPPPPPADTVPPAVSGFTVSARRASFTLSEPADVRIVITRRHKRVRTLALLGRPAGASTARLHLRKRGRYSATLTATDRAGNRSARRIRFRLTHR